jgi:hypothetical protein
MATFNIPDLGANDPKQVADELGDLDPELLAERARSVELLSGVNSTDVTPPRLAWLILWSQIFAAIRGVQAAIVFRSRLLLESTWRFSFETFLHLQAIMEPVLDGTDGAPDAPTPEAKAREVERRLTAFTAWCLWNDDNHIDWMMDPRTVQSLNQVVERTDLEADLSALRSQRQEIWDLMDTESLDPWIRKMDRRRDGPDERHVFSFYELLGLETTSVTQRLITLNSGASIGAYSRASVILHGSTANHFLAVNEGTVTPRLPQGTAIESASKPYITVSLDLLQQTKTLLWPDASLD